MNTNYVLRYPHSYFAADRACAVVRQFVADAVRSVNVAYDG